MVKEDVLIFAAVFGVMGLTGLAVLLKSGRPLTVRAVTANMLFSGLMGMGNCMVFWGFREQLGISVWTPIGVAVLIGLSGLKALDALDWMLSFLVRIKKND